MSTKTNNPKLICRCGAEIPAVAIWVLCSCGALHHFKRNGEGRLKTSVCHTGKEAIRQINRLKAKGITIVQLKKRVKKRQFSLRSSFV